jgi:hypothetical protein
MRIEALPDLLDLPASPQAFLFFVFLKGFIDWEFQICGWC